MKEVVRSAPSDLRNRPVHSRGLIIMGKFRKSLRIYWSTDLEDLSKVKGWDPYSLIETMGLMAEQWTVYFLLHQLFTNQMSTTKQTEPRLKFKKKRSEICPLKSFVLVPGTYPESFRMILQKLLIFRARNWKSRGQFNYTVALTSDWL